MAQHRRGETFIRRTATACSSSATSAPWPSSAPAAPLPRQRAGACTAAPTAPTTGGASSRRSTACKSGRSSCSPTDPDVILVGTCPSRLFRSGDGGQDLDRAGGAHAADCPRIIHTRVTTLRPTPRPGHRLGRRGDRRPLPQPRRRADLADGRPGPQLAGHPRLAIVPGNGRPRLICHHQQRPQRQHGQRRNMAAAAGRTSRCRGRTAGAGAEVRTSRRWC